MRFHYCDVIKGTITSLTYCLLNRLFRRRSKKTSKLRVTGLCAGNLPVTSEFPAQMASNAENVSIWWRHHVIDDIWNTPGIRPMFFLVEGCSLRCCLWGLTIGLDIGLEPNRRHDRYEICPLPVYLLLCLILFVFVLHSVCIYYSISFTAKSGPQILLQLLLSAELFMKTIQFKGQSLPEGVFGTALCGGLPILCSVLVKLSNANNILP